LGCGLGAWKLGPMIKHPWLAAYVIALSLFGVACATTVPPDGGSPPSTVQNVVGIVAKCGEQAAAPLLEAEIPKVTLALTALDFKLADEQLRGVVGDLLNGGLGLEVAWQALSCVVAEVRAHAFVDAKYADSLATRRVENANLWIEAHQVTFTGDAPMPPSAAPAIKATP
jgi:hypothetical protein